MKKDILKLALTFVDIVITLFAILGLIWLFFIK